ncbi:MAG TPA: hypothetical protein VJ740_15470 [Hyphomicrobiaceae bacterium]|nr:hypothetical protein [Hyphomicrobiaceae bacterium]
MISVRALAGVLGVVAFTAIGAAEEQDRSREQPGPTAPNVKRQPAPLPPPRRIAPAETLPPPAAGETLPDAGSCPDRGRKLELIA